MSGNKPINKKLRGIRDAIPPGYVVGRTGQGNGPPILLPISNFASKGYVANTTIQVGGPAGGDLSGTYPNPTVAKIQGNAVSNAAPTNLQVLQWVNANSDWEPSTIGTLPTGGTVGQVLEKNSGTNFDASWQTLAAPASALDDGTNFYLALQDATGQLVLDGSDDPIFVPEVLPATSIPVDNSTIIVVAGALASQLPTAYGFARTLNTPQSITTNIVTTLLSDTSLFSTVGSDFNAATGIFTPSKAGTYIIYGSLRGELSNGLHTAELLAGYLQFNGVYLTGTTLMVSEANGLSSAIAANVTGTVMCFAIQKFNGSTDNVQMQGQVFSATSEAAQFDGSSIYCFFGAVRIGA